MVCGEAPIERVEAAIFGGGLVILYFNDIRNAACRIMNPIISDIGKFGLDVRHDSLSVYYFNRVRKSFYEEAAAHFGVVNVPTTLFYLGGRLRRCSEDILLRSDIDHIIGAFCAEGGR